MLNITQVEGAQEGAVSGEEIHLQNLSTLGAGYGRVMRVEAPMAYFVLLG